MNSRKNIKFASVNIEHNLHNISVLKFLKDNRPDVFCLQELLQVDIPMFESELGVKCVFAPMAETPVVRGDLSSPTTLIGVGIFSNSPFKNSSAHYYFGDSNVIPPFYRDSKTGVLLTNKVLLQAKIVFYDDVYTFATTHFTWTPDGKVNNDQKVDLSNLFKVLDLIPEFVLAGDFNAPRGGEIFAQIENKYKDNIPKHYSTSIDKNLHRAGDLQLMVDGLFSTPTYEISEVELCDGVSDHMAIKALVLKHS